MTAKLRRRAFLLGCNASGLRHCAADAQRLAKALHAVGWETEHCYSRENLPSFGNGSITGKPRPSREGDAALSVLSEFLDASKHGESQLIYFSGHSRYSNGVLSLLVGDDANARGDLLSIEVLIAKLKEDPHPADRLLILDCCDAGKGVAEGFWEGLMDGAWGRIWVATRGNEQAQELDGDTQGGLFTALLLRALRGEMPRAISKHGCMYLDRLDIEVREAAGKIVLSSGKPAPIPNVHGATRHNILLASGIEVATAFSAQALEYLETLLITAGDETRMAALYAEISRACGLTAADDYRGSVISDQRPTPGQLIERLAAAWYRPKQPVPMPLAEFVWRVAQWADNGVRLKHWVRDTMHMLQPVLDPERTAEAFIGSLRLGQTATVRPAIKTHLAIAIWPRDGNAVTQYSIEARLVDRSGKGNRVDLETGLASIDALSERLPRVLKSDAVEELNSQLDRPLAIELFLPKALLCRNPDDWFGGGKAWKAAIDYQVYRDGARAGASQTAGRQCLRGM